MTAWAIRNWSVIHSTAVMKPLVINKTAWNMSYALILYNTLTNSSDHQAVQERIFELCYHIKAIVTLYQQKYGLRFAQGIIMHPLVVISYSLLPRMQDLRSQPLIESCVWDMLEMVDNLKILKAVVHIYGIAARKAHIKWPTDLELALQECTPDPNICADYPVLGPNFTLDAGDGESESGRVARVSDLLEEWGEGGQQ
ncbi:hypothetical protein UCRPC4_g06604 [Phaeomoniella chlamydospora]|uniref:Uncharacterized protein n=1 Tax=Phaeomoniella chlamydospora TaxID=158046 RepID=A0A0G2DXN6_PHACM|nr:hypothetical protein UCRPC4_g06604 [Phaeomoniella chlamydospora]